MATRSSTSKGQSARAATTSSSSVKRSSARKTPRFVGKGDVKSGTIPREDAVPRQVTRVTADLPTRDAETISRIAAKLGLNKVSALSRAIRVLDRIETAWDAGDRVILESKDGTRTELPSF